MIIHRRILIALGWLALGCQGRAAAPVLTPADVTLILEQGAKASMTFNPNSVIAVTDREGFVLGVYGVSGPPTTQQQVNAIDKAGTSSYLSSNGEAFTTRTAGYIIQPHFPPGIMNAAPGPLVGVGFSSLSFSDINHFRNPANPDPGIAGTTLSGNPGGVPLYKDGELVGGVGVDGNPASDALTFVPGADVDEDIAVIAQSGYGAPQSIVATQVLLNGFRLPYTDYGGGGLGVAALVPANISTTFPVTGSSGVAFDPGVVPYNNGPYPQTPLPAPSPYPDIPGGEVRDPIIGSPLASTVEGQPRLSQAEVSTILHQAAVRAAETRGAIRNPAGSPAEVFIVVIDYYGTDAGGTPVAYTQPLPPPSTAPYSFPRPGILGSFRTPDATLFSYDVAAQKARTALFFSNNSMAMSTRTIGFLAQSTYPPGIDGTSPGPYYLLQNDLSVASPANQNASVNPYLPNGITIFPGGFPLYRNGVLIGAIGVSGDGVDQDDLIAAAGTVGFEAPDAIRADEFTYNGARLPYAKFPQNASL